MFAKCLPMPKFGSMPTNANSCFQSLAPLSEITLSGSVCNCTTCWMNKMVNFLADGSLQHGIKWDCLESTYTMTRMTVFPCIGRSPIMSMVTVDQGLQGVSIGCNNPGCLPVLGLLIK